MNVIFLKKLKETYNVIPLPAKAAIWFTACNFLLRGLGFITGPLFTRLLSSEEYGKQSIYLSYEQLILILSTWEIQLGAYQKGIFKYKNDIKLFTTSTQALVNSLTVGFFLIIFMFYPNFIKLTSLPSNITFLMFLFLLTKPAYECWLTRLRKNYGYKKVVLATVCFTLLNIILPIIALTSIGATAEIKLCSTLIGSTIFCFLFFLHHADYWNIIPNLPKVKEYWKFCINFEGPLVLHSLSFYILAQADRIMISKMVGNSEAAFYSVAYSIANIISLLQVSINQSLSPWRYQMLEEHNYNAINQVTDKLIIFFGIVIVAFVMIIPECMQVVFPIDYFEAVWCIPPIATSIFFMFLYSIFVNIEEYFERTKYVVYVSTTCGIINIFLNYYFIKQFGYIACAYTTLVSYILFALFHYVFMKKTLAEEGITHNLVNATHVTIISCIITIWIIFTTYLYNYIYIRYALFSVVTVILFLKKKTILHTYKQMKIKPSND